MNPKTANHLAGWKLDAASVVVLAVLTGLAYLVIVQPMARRQGELTQLRAELSATESHAAAAQVSRAALDARLTRIRGEIEVSPVKLEPVVHLNRRIARVVELASSSGMIIHETRSGEVVEGPRYLTVPVEISGSGPYSRCAAFLHHLRNELPDVEVFGFELSGNPASPESRSVFRFDLGWYAAANQVAAMDTKP